MKKFFNELSIFNKVCLVLAIICGVLGIIGVIIFFTVPNVVIKIISGAILGVSAVILILVGVLVQIFS